MGEGADKPVGLLGTIRRVHFVGVGGIGMSGLAELLMNLGYGVSGSDLSRSDITDRLAALGARVCQGHDAGHVGDAQVVVYSSAVRATNPEIVAARRGGIPVMARAEMLAELMNLRYGIAVAGAHGKTTTTSMISVVLEHAGLDPTAAIGGRLSAFGSNARLGRGLYMVAEADESDRSFLRLSPRLAVITNIDREHMDAYAGMEDLQQAFLEFARRVPPDGAVIACADDFRLRGLQAAAGRRMVMYGVDWPEADLAARDVRLSGLTSSCRVSRRRSPARSGPDDLGLLALAVPGRHNVQNAMAAVAVGLELGVPFGTIAEALAGFRGVERRFQLRGDVNGVRVFDDYGHHPTELAAVVAAARPLARGRLIVAFQPHRYTRTHDLMTSFGPALSGADVIILTAIYPAGEEPVPGVTLDALAESVRGSVTAAVEVVDALEEVPRAIARAARPGDLVVTLGAGSIGSIWPRVLEELKAAR
jgi:UDP-N-acetylmuramate--alanine ligase